MHFFVLRPIKQLTKGSKKDQVFSYILHDLLNDENDDENEGQYNVITNYDYPINIYYNKEIKERLSNLASNTTKNKDYLEKNSFKTSDDNLSGSRDDGIEGADTRSTESQDNLLPSYTPPIQIPFEELEKEMRRILNNKENSHILENPGE
mmetsp:Transcript_11350/g.12832  ORF Transcript_11350/g.12832 Transcript_11350/m.12832 type:complete len:150 (+) Transcript_11350:854-1303(+)